jgi:phosphatidylserine/phosphatidylglycerophosphate/cardiolipin synthase-like enzyme
MNDPCQLLTDADLHALAAALRCGRLSRPFSPVAVLPYCAAASAGGVAARMQRLAEEGLKPEHLALLMETIAQARLQRPHESDLLDLVWTGPETPGTFNRDTGVVVRELFSGAQEYVLVAGYAVYQGREVFRSLADRMAQRPGLKVRMFLDVHRHPADSSPPSELLERFAHRFRTHDWPGERLPELFYDPRSIVLEVEKRSSLHAKCVVVDRKVGFVSSANFTEAAQVRNIEVGALIRSRWFATRLAEHFETLAAAGLLLPLPGISSSS